MPRDQDDERNAILEVRAGTGGEEAALFAADLFRIYQRYAGLRGGRRRRGQAGDGRPARPSKLSGKATKARGPRWVGRRFTPNSL